jgi:hypothetical protein
MQAAITMQPVGTGFKPAQPGTTTKPPGVKVEPVKVDPITGDLKSTDKI